MTIGNDSSDEPVLFSARLTPHRSLDRTGFTILMIAISAISFGAGLMFFLMGAWPVFGFFGLDVLLVYWAFRANFRSARASEDIVVTPGELRFRRTSAKGHTIEWSANPLWVGLHRIESEDFGVERLYLRSGGRSVAIGNFLAPEEKASFANALMAALHAARRGYPLPG